MSSHALARAGQGPVTSPQHRPTRPGCSHKNRCAPNPGCSRTLRDNQNHVYKFGTYKIKAHGFVRIHTGKGTNSQTNRYWGQGWYVWNNTGDRATLKDNNGNLIDRCSYSGGGSHKIC